MFAPSTDVDKRLEVSDPVLDVDPRTYWHSERGTSQTNRVELMVLPFDTATVFAAIKALPEQARTRTNRTDPLGWVRHAGRFETSIRSRWSIRSILSFASAGSVGSAFSIASMLSVFSAGSILSLNSAGSILSINSVGSILSINSCGAILTRNGGSASEAASADGDRVASMQHAAP